MNDLVPSPEEVTEMAPDLVPAWAHAMALEWTKKVKTNFTRIVSMVQNTKHVSKLRFARSCIKPTIGPILSVFVSFVSARAYRKGNPRES